VPSFSDSESTGCAFGSNPPSVLQRRREGHDGFQARCHSQIFSSEAFHASEGRLRQPPRHSIMGKEAPRDCGSIGVSSEVKHKDFSPRRIYWHSFIAISAAGVLILSLIAGVIWGLIKAAQAFPWTG